MRNNKTYNIGVQYLEAYPEKKNIINQVAKANYIFVADYYRKIIDFKLRLRRYSKLKRIFGKLIYQTSKERYSFFLNNQNNNIDFFHFFNTINLKAKQAWGVTFETSLPAYESFSQFHKGHYENGNLKALKEIEKYLKALADDKCKFIIAISKCTFDIQSSILDVFPEYNQAILSKIHILHPPQPLLINSIAEKNYDENCINFMFIGTEFLGKGGVEILHVFEKIKNDYKNFHLYLIGNFSRASSCTQNISSIERKKLKSLIVDNLDMITYYEYLPNDEILKLLKNKIQVGMLPTRGDTYGNSVLEFQAAGCPVVSTDVRALSEINSEDCGWIINVDKNKFGESYHFNIGDLNRLQNQIENQLEIIIKDILEHPEKIKPKAKSALERIKQEHSPKLFSKRLLEIYQNTIL